MRKFKYIGRNLYLLLHIPRLSEPYLFKRSEDYTCNVQDKDAEYMEVAYRGKLEEILPEQEEIIPVVCNEEAPEPEEVSLLPPPLPALPLLPRKTIKKKPVKKKVVSRKPKAKEKNVD